MKNYEEISRNVLRRRDEIISERERKKKLIIRVSSPAAALCLSVMIGVGVWQSGGGINNDPDIVEDALYPGIPDYIDENNVGGKGDTSFCADEEGIFETGTGRYETYPAIYPTTDPKNDGEADTPDSEPTIDVYTFAESDEEYIMNDPVATTTGDKLSSGAFTDLPDALPSNVDKNPVITDPFYVNIVIGEATAAVPYYDPELYCEERWSGAQITEYLGIDPAEFGKELPSELFYETNDYFKIVRSLDGEIVYDAAHFVYSDGGEGRLTISASRTSVPYDCIYVLASEQCTEFTLSDGETVPVLIGVLDDDPDSFESYELIFADFECRGVKYRVAMENISKSKVFYTALKLIIG